MYYVKQVFLFIKRVYSGLIRSGQLIRYKAESIFLPSRTIWFCPCCGLKFKQFISGHFFERPERYNPERYENTRQDVICPYCGSLPRHRILACWCEKNIDTLKSADILYFASEPSMSLWTKRKGICFTTADMYQRADLKLDIQSTGLDENSYGMIFCNHVLEHVEDFRISLKEVHRILKSGGYFICSFPMDPRTEIVDEDKGVDTDADRYRHYGQVDHRRVFGTKADQLLRQAGFEVEAINGENFPDEILPVVGPADYDINRLFCCRKG